MRHLTLAVVFSLVAVAAGAQSPYVGGTIGADVSRFSQATSNVASSESGDSEVISGSLRVGTSLGQNWGVELEFVRSGQSRGQVPPPIYYSPLASGANSFTVVPAGVSSIAFPVGGFQTDVRQSHYDFDTVAWVRQGAGSKVDLVYVAGVAFSHRRVEISQTFPTVIRALLPVPGGAFRTTAIDYSARPLVGAEARIGLTSHVRLIPGLRLQGLADGWLLRPYAGLGWFF
jgi:hypothetical protein